MDDVAEVAADVVAETVGEVTVAIFAETATDGRAGRDHPGIRRLNSSSDINDVYSGNDPLGKGTLGQRIAQNNCCGNIKAY
jgi:hypothetical protein